MSPKNFVKLDLIRPVGHDVMLLSNNRDCFEIALKTIKADVNVSDAKELIHADSNWTSHETNKAWADVKSGINTKQLIPQLAVKVRTDLIEKGITDCEVTFALGSD